MRLDQLKLTCLFSILLLLCMANPGEAEDNSKAPIEGLVLPNRVSKDSVELRLDLTCRMADLDSIVCSLESPHGLRGDTNSLRFVDSSGSEWTTVTAFRRNSIGSPPVLQSQVMTGGEVRLFGLILVRFHGAEPTSYRLRMTYYNAHSMVRIYSVPLIWQKEGVKGGILIPSAGYYDSKLSRDLNKTGLFLGYSAGGEYVYPHAGLAIETSWSGIGKNFSFSDPLRVSARVYALPRNSYGPFLEVAGKLSKLKVKEGDRESRKVDWGGEVGGGFSTPFDRCSYSYSSTVGGFHTIELQLGSMSTGLAGRAGTLYRYRWAEGIRTFEISAYLEGFDPDDIPRRHHRPWPLRLLSDLAWLPLKSVLIGIWKH